MEVDLGGIAKGYAIDRAAEALQQAGASGGIVDVGHDLRLFGTPEHGGKWRVGVHRPPGVTREFILEVGPCAVTTSGDYARGFLIDNKWFSHIIDPRTGRPATDVTSVTVVGPDATSADAMATALSVMGPEEGLALVEGLREFECLFMTRMPHGSVEFQMSSGFDSLLLEE
jgi:thiamine biosynthesis lipoprotein